MGPSPIRGGVMVISVWTDPDELGELRARFTATRDLISTGDSETWTAVGVEPACAVLRRWLVGIVHPIVEEED
jgi:hypothetical protein